MTITEIAAQRTQLDTLYVQGILGTGIKGFHESLLRSFHIVNKLRELLEQGTPPKVILEMLDVMEGKSATP